MTNFANKKLMWFTTIAVCSLSLLCSGCGANYQKYLQEKHAQEEAHAEKSYSLPFFSAIVVRGSSSIELTDGAPYVSFDGKKKELDAAHITTVVKNDVLYVHSAISAPPIIRLRANNINNITVQDNAYLIGKDFSAKDLRVTASGHGAITFNSKLNVTHIKQLGTGNLDIKWIDSEEVFVESGSAGQVRLAGVTKTLYAKLFHNAHVDARHLRAQKAKVFTTNSARADVFAIQQLNAYADNSSNVLYYKRPQKLNKVSKESGNVLLIEELR